jgi:hypothetical protein
MDCKTCAGTGFTISQELIRSAYVAIIAAVRENKEGQHSPPPGDDTHPTGPD